MALSAALPMERAPAHTAYEIVTVDEAFAAATKMPPGLPLLCCPDGSLCEPVVAFAMLRKGEDRKEIGTIRQEIYVLREWVARCAALRKSLWEPDDDTLEAWRTEMRSALGAKRAETKVTTVFRFYAALHRALPWDSAGRRRSPFVVPVGTSLPGTRQLTSRTTDGGTIWHRAEAASQNQAQLSTPDPYQVRTVLDRLRTPLRGGPGRLGADEDLPKLCAERNYVIGSIMAEGGLRAAEAAQFSLPVVWSMLLAQPDLQLPDRTADWRVLDAIASDPAARVSLLDGIDGIRGTFQFSMFFHVRGKGSKERLVDLPVSLVKELLDIAIFHVRRRQLEIWTAAGWAGTASPEMFLSFKTREKLKPGAVGDLIAAAFNLQPAIPGSAHRLRAYFATQTAIRIWQRCLRLNGGIGNVSAQETALVLLKNALGHAHVTTTIRHYLSLAQFYLARVNCGMPKSDALIGAFHELRGSLSAARTALATRIVTALGSCPDEHLLCLALEEVLNQVPPVSI